MKHTLRIAIVQDYLAQMGGAERVTECLCSLFPEADLYSTFVVPERLSGTLKNTTVRTTWMQLLPRKDRLYRHYFLLYPFAIETLDLSRYDVVISSCSGYAKGVRKKTGAAHICYCHTPMRWVWRYDDYTAREQVGAVSKAVLPAALSALKKWDLRAAKRPDVFIANSTVVAERIRQCYGRGALVVHPPVDTHRFRLASSIGDYYLVLSRLVGYKRIDLAIKACTQLRKRLIIVGDGPDRPRLERIAGPTVHFLGRQPDEVVAHYASECRALIFPGEEDFGIAPLEVNAAGRPVLAFCGGGARDTVIDGETGVFFDQPTVSSLVEAIRKIERQDWNSQLIRRHALLYDRSAFAIKLQSVVADYCGCDELVVPAVEQDSVIAETRLARVHL
jgi:glycosyltransferase involved in cell wall biosynthesis